MRRILVITLLMAFATGAIAQEKCPNKTCESTWMQWFGNTATLAWAYAGVSAYSPRMQGFNAMLAAKGVEQISLASTWIMAKYAARFGGASGATTDGSPMTKID